MSKLRKADICKEDEKHKYMLYYEMFDSIKIDLIKKEKNEKPRFNLEGNTSLSVPLTLCIFSFLCSTCDRLEWWESLWNFSAQGSPSSPLLTGPPSPTCAPSTEPPWASSQWTKKVYSTYDRLVSKRGEGLGDGGGMKGSKPL